MDVPLVVARRQTNDWEEELATTWASQVLRLETWDSGDIMHVMLQKEIEKKPERLSQDKSASPAHGGLLSLAF